MCFRLDWWDIGLRLGETYHPAPDWAGRTGTASALGIVLHSKALARNVNTHGPLSSLLRGMRDKTDKKFLLTPLAGYYPLASAVLSGEKRGHCYTSISKSSCRL